MDALDVIMNKDKIIPYFQPIVSADTQLVIGYEALARIQVEDGVQSLGWFFKDQSIPEEYRQEVDEHVCHLAIEKLLEHDIEAKLFINVDMNEILENNGEHLINNLKAYESRGLSLSSIVIEFAEQDFKGNISSLKHLLTYIQSLGIQIAIDDVGKTGSNLDQIALLRPNIVKVDLEFLEGDAFPQLYRDVLYSLSLLTRKIGATLMFEGIGSFNQLNYAWRNGGHYYQGYYLSRPKPTFQEIDFCKSSLKKEFHHFIHFERKKIEAQITLTEKLSQLIRHSIKKVKALDSYDAVVMQIAKELSNISFRVYICDHDGYQQSGNAVKDEENNWNLQEGSRFKNWSWRPYFLENIVRMNYEKRGILSDLYTDIEKDEMIRTYSFPIDDHLFLFVDIPYSYLFEQDGLM
ncbi:EAL domain-containing protein [Alkalihalobacterium chitinilyticum]|uniref:EAL domain-containing protein n=1 Tax=Alkalihalobacterium chitinilyticum TaxID=2980103 RepID=A0ABT5VBH2_9BACI|nr:EAL-associated domain-containing protein [Alkalihalobacterium chitinilyticum]MDE5412811.1 EAL domain-containing protein [Alkalihalobacterium chitinilyticum]